MGHGYYYKVELHFAFRGGNLFYRSIFIIDKQWVKDGMDVDNIIAGWERKYLLVRDNNNHPGPATVYIRLYDSGNELRELDVINYFKGEFSWIVSKTISEQQKFQVDSVKEYKRREELFFEDIDDDYYEESFVLGRMYQAGMNNLLKNSLRAIIVISCLMIILLWVIFLG